MKTSNFFTISCLGVFILCASFAETIHAQEAGDRLNERKWGSISEGFQISIYPEKETNTICEPLALSVAIRNTTDRTLEFFDQKGYRFSLNTVIVQNHAGKEVSFTKKQTASPAENRKILSREEALEIFKKHEVDSFFRRRLGSSQKFHYSGKLMVNLPVPGIYSVAIKRNMPKLDGAKGSSEIISNFIRVKVIERKADSNCNNIDNEFQPEIIIYDSTRPALRREKKAVPYDSKKHGVMWWGIKNKRTQEKPDRVR